MAKTRNRESRKSRILSSTDDSDSISSTPRKRQKSPERQINMAEAKLETLIQHIPSFDNKKETNIKFFLDQWDKLAEKSKLPKEIKLILLKSKFSGPARDVLVNSQELYEETSYEKFKELIAAEFKIKIQFEDVQNSFMNLKQSPNQKMPEFIKQFDIAATKYIEESGHSKELGAINFLKRVKLTRFLEAIRPDIALEIRKQGPATYDEATQIAVKIENAFNASKFENMNNTTDTENFIDETLNVLTKVHQDEIQKLKDEIERLKINAQPPVEKKKEKCGICSKNHSTKDCFFNGRNKRQEPSFRTPMSRRDHYIHYNPDWNYTGNYNVQNNGAQIGYSNQHFEQNEQHYNRPPPENFNMRQRDSQQSIFNGNSRNYNQRPNYTGNYRGTAAANNRRGRRNYQTGNDNKNRYGNNNTKKNYLN